jgi:hypothetical protein
LNESQPLQTIASSYLKECGIEHDMQPYERYRNGQALTSDQFALTPFHVYVRLADAQLDRHGVERLFDHAWRTYGDDSHAWEALAWDLLAQLADWRTEVNTQRPCRATRVIPAVRLEDERPRLRPLKVAPAALALRVPVVVGPTGAVLHDTHPYSMPPDAIGIAGTLFLYRDRVRIVAGRFEAVHERLFVPYAKSTLPEHRAEQVAAVSGKRAKRHLQREHLLELGPSALDYLTELTHRRPRIWLRDVDRLHALLATYGAEAMCAAFARGLAEQATGAEYIAHYLAAVVTIPRSIVSIEPRAFDLPTEDADDTTQH